MDAAAAAAAAAAFERGLMLRLLPDRWPTHGPDDRWFDGTTAVSPVGMGLNGAGLVRMGTQTRQESAALLMLFWGWIEAKNDENARQAPLLPSLP